MLFRFFFGLLCIGLACLPGVPVWGQPSEFEDITLTGGADLHADFSLRPGNDPDKQFRLFARSAAASTAGLLNIDTPDVNGAVRIYAGAIAKRLVTSSAGVALGHDAPTQPLHISSQGLAFPASPIARMLIEDRNSAVAVRNLLTLSNNGGIGIAFENWKSLDNWYVQSNNSDSLSITMLSTGPPTFSIRETGQVVMKVGNTNTMVLQPNGDLIIAGGLTSQSDLHAKRDFAPTDPAKILQQVVQLPIASWQFKNEDANNRHIGPMAQDFRASFGLGLDEKTISPSDTIGVSLSAIQGLHGQLQERNARLAELEKRIQQQRAGFQQRMDELRAVLTAANQ